MLLGNNTINTYTHAQTHMHRGCSGDTHLQGDPDGQQRVLRVLALGLARGAQVVIRTHGTLESGSHHRTLAAIAGHARVGEGRGMVVGRGRGMVVRRGRGMVVGRGRARVMGRSGWEEE